MKEGEDISDYKLFRAEVKKQLSLRGWRHKDLAEAIGYSVNSIDTFMCGARVSGKLAEAISRELKIPIK